MLPSQTASGLGRTSQRARLRLIDGLRQRGIHDEAVLDAMLNTPRHLFVRPAEQSRAYEDVALSIGNGQTISQPYIVARMTQLAGISAPQTKRVLDVGTGCGYQAAIAASLCDWVFSIERIADLSRAAQKRLDGLGIKNLSYRHGDGYQGWANKAPFDAIIVAAAPAETPVALLEQLSPTGRLVIPVGNQHHQRLRVIRRKGLGFETSDHEGVRFVPLISGKTQ